MKEYFYQNALQMYNLGTLGTLWDHLTTNLCTYCSELAPHIDQDQFSSRNSISHPSPLISQSKLSQERLLLYLLPFERHGVGIIRKDRSQ